MRSLEQSTVRNHLIASLAEDDFARLSPGLQQVKLRLRAPLHAASETISVVYFPEQGYASMLALMEAGDGVEVGLIGFEGLIGTAVVLGGDRSPVEAVVQSEGSALSLSADILRRILDESASFRAVMLRYAMSLNVQVTMTAACNSRHRVEQRLARWLLMAHDRCGDDEFTMTHDFLSMMLGVRRAGVSVAAGALQRAGFIRYEHGKIRIIDRPGLLRAACECHGVALREYVRLLGMPGQS